MKPFIETNPAYDEYAGKALGLYLKNLCILGVMFWKENKQPGAWSIAIIILNIAIGIWQEP